MSKKLEFRGCEFIGDIYDAPKCAICDEDLINPWVVFNPTERNAFLCESHYKQWQIWRCKKLRKKLRKKYRGAT